MSRFIVSMVMIPISSLLIWVFFMLKSRVKHCTTVIWAECSNYNVYPGKCRAYAAIFRYTWQGVVYEEQSPFTYPKRKFNEQFQIGKQYQIFIDENHPKRCINSKNIPANGYLCLILGIFFWLVYIAVMLGI